jgi:ketosteroid isomerase-like protein
LRETEHQATAVLLVARWSSERRGAERDSIALKAALSCWRLISRDTAWAMSQENVEIVRSAFAAFERGDASELTDLMADDLVIHRAEPDNAFYYGKEGFFEATADWIEGFDDWKATPEEYVEAGDTVLVQVHQTARGKGSGVPVESHFWFVFDLRGGKVVGLAFLTSKAAAFEAAGLSE